MTEILDQNSSPLTLRSPDLQENISPELFDFLPDLQREHIADSLQLLHYYQSCKEHTHIDGKQVHPLPDFYDHSFIVFPIAKAYEGFLKYYLFQFGVLSKHQYKSRDLRIGRILNPDLPQRFRDEEWIFDDVSQLCSPEMAQEMWQIWLTGRNHLFHYFPDERHVLSFTEAHAKVKEFLRVMEHALACQIQTQL